METQIINDNSCIRVINDGTPLLINKAQIKTIDTVKNELVRIDIGEGALRHIYIRATEVTLPAGLADVNALRDAIKAMLDGTDCCAQMTAIAQSELGKMAEVKASVDTLGQNQSAQLGNVLTALGQIKDALNGNNDRFREPVRIDESNPLVIYNGFVASFSAAGPTASDPLWAVQKVMRTGDTFIYLWANGNKQFTNIWDNRETLDYQPLGA
jgi:hypothetical protein